MEIREGTLSAVRILDPINAIIVVRSPWELLAATADNQAEKSKSH